MRSGTEHLGALGIDECLEQPGNHLVDHIDVGMVGEYVNRKLAPPPPCW